jgi:CubicO group peptidase (beta-lactamase class C family)
MVEDGALDLDAPLSAYLPEPYVKDDPLLGEITARRVLCHTTGWPNWRPEGGLLLREWAPGERFGYSGEGYIYLQRVVEYLTHEPLDMYMRRTVLEPLAMKHSSYAWAPPGANGPAAAHDKAGRPIEPYIGSHPESASSLHTTPGDFATFLCGLLNPGAEQGRLRAEAAAEMLRVQVHIEGPISWALGWGLQTTAEGQVIWQWGDNPGYKNFALAVPSRRLGLVVMTNGDGGAALWEPLTRLVVGGEHPLFNWLMRTFFRTPR